MNKKILIRHYKKELRVIETQLQLTRQTINEITNRKVTVIEALKDLGVNSFGAPLPGQNPLSDKQLRELKSDITKKASRQRGSLTE